MQDDRLVRIAPIVVPRALIDVLTMTAATMSSPMHPSVSIAWAARELVARGCEVLEGMLGAGISIEWLVADPPRGHRRRSGADATPRADRREFVSLPSLALHASQVKRLAVLRRRLAAVTRTRTSLARTVREVIARGSAQRERQRQDAEALLALHRAQLAAAGLPDPFPTAVASVQVIVPYKAPGRDARASAEWTRPIVLTPRAPTGTEPLRPDALDEKPPRPEKAPRRAGSARAPRRRRGPARRSSSPADGDADGDGDGDPSDSHASPIAAWGWS